MREQNKINQKMAVQEKRGQTLYKTKKKEEK